MLNELSNIYNITDSFTSEKYFVRGDRNSQLSIGWCYIRASWGDEHTSSSMLVTQSESKALEGQGIAVYPLESSTEYTDGRASGLPQRGTITNLSRVMPFQVPIIGYANEFILGHPTGAEGVLLAAGFNNLGYVHIV